MLLKINILPMAPLNLSPLSRGRRVILDHEQGISSRAGDVKKGRTPQDTTFISSFSFQTSIKSSIQSKCYCLRLLLNKSWPVLTILTSKSCYTRFAIVICPVHCQFSTFYFKAIDGVLFSPLAFTKDRYFVTII